MTEWPRNMVIRPLQHPGILRPDQRSTALFKSTQTSTLRTLRRELEHLDAKQVVLEIDITERDLRIDGMPRSQAKPSTPAVALSFESRYGPLRYATDTFHEWEDNLRAITLGLEALRKVDRYGVSKRGEQYTGWRAIEAPVITDEQLIAEMRTLIRRAVPSTEIDEKIDLLAPEALIIVAKRTLHPDNQVTGDADAFIRVSQIQEELQKAGAL